jgi:hypothetical protein
MWNMKAPASNITIKDMAEAKAVEDISKTIII